MPLRSAAAAVLLASLFGVTDAARAAERPLPLAEAITMALDNNEDILVERESLVSADAAVTGARGPYDPLLALDGGWSQNTVPVNSSFSGAPIGRLAPTGEVTEANASVSQLLPTGGRVELRGRADRQTTNGVFNLLSPAYGTSLAVELRQPLLRDLAVDPVRAGIRVAAADRERAAAGLRQQVTDTVAAVERAYWTLTAARREVEVREEAKRLAEEQLAETDERIKSGMSPETEAAQPRAELERRRGELLAAQEEASRAENALKLLILGESDGDGGWWNDRLVPAEPAEPRVAGVDVAGAIARALQVRPELAAVGAVVERRRVETALALNAVRPALDAVVAYERFGLAGTLNPAGTPPPGTGVVVPPQLEGGLDDSFEVLREGDLDNTQIALVFALPIGNRQARAGAEIAKSAERQAEADLVRARKQVRTEVLDAAAALQTAGQRIEAARAAREAAEVQLMAERERFRAGMSINFLVLTRQNDLSSARLEEIAAQTDYRQAATELARATGDLLAEHGVTLADEDSTNGSAP